MKSTIKKIFITYLVIICCIYTPTAQAAGWSFGGYNFGNGSLNITQNGVKITTAAVSTAPITSNLGSKILSGAIRGASVLSALSIISGLAEDAIDWVLDPANNRIKYKPKVGANTGSYVSRDYPSVTGTSLQSVCNAIKAYVDSSSRTYIIDWSASSESADSFMCRMHLGDPSNSWGFSGTIKKDTAERTVSIPTVANKIYDIAKSGNTSAQADVTSAVTNLVNAGTYDTPINQAIQDAINNGTLPKDTTDTPTDPTNPTKPEIDTSSITAAIQSLASSFASAISDAFNGITSVINTSIDKLLNKQDQIQGELVNTGSKIDAVGGKVVGVGEDVKDVGGKVVGVGDAVKDVGGKVVGLNDSVDKVGDAVVGVGDKVTAGTDAVGTKVDAVGDKVTGVGADVRGVGDKVTAGTDAVGTKVDAVGDKVTGVGADVRGVGDKVTAGTDAVGTKVDAVGDKVADAVKDSTKEITDKMEQTKPKDFELPAFCSWASKVCDFIDWVKLEPDIEGTPVPTDNTPLKNPSEFDKDYINVIAQCPPDVVREIPLPGQSFNLVFGMSPVCDFASTYLRPVIIFLAYIYGALSIGNAFKVGG